MNPQSKSFIDKTLGNDWCETLLWRTLIGEIHHLVKFLRENNASEKTEEQSGALRITLMSAISLYWDEKDRLRTANLLFRTSVKFLYKHDTRLIWDDFEFAPFEELASRSKELIASLLKELSSHIKLDSNVIDLSQEFDRAEPQADQVQNEIPATKAAWYGHDYLARDDKAPDTDEGFLE